MGFRRNPGTTLIETLIALIILNIGLSALLGTFMIANMSVARAKHRIEVVNILQKKVEELKNTQYPNIVSSGPSQVVIDIGPDLVKGTADDLMGSQTVTVVDKTGYKHLSVKLSWKEVGWGASGTSVSETLVTFISAGSIYLTA